MTKEIPSIVYNVLLSTAENLYKRGRIKDSAIILEFLGRGNKKDLEKKLKREFEGK